MTKPEPSWVHVHNKDEMEAFYRGVLPNIITEAKYHGYAIGLHGSLRRDLDLIAVPWTDDHSDKDELARAVQEAACGMPSAKYQWEKKPCGRWAASFPICWTEMTNELSLGHIDLSVMSSARPEAPRNIFIDEDHKRGCEGRNYSCTCGYDERMLSRGVELERRLSAGRKCDSCGQIRYGEQECSDTLCAFVPSPPRQSEPTPACKTLAGGFCEVCDSWVTPGMCGRCPPMGLGRS